MPYKDDEIRQLLREERSRGRKPPLSQEEIRRQLENLRIVEGLLKERNISNFIKALSEIGLRKESKYYHEALVAWHDHWRRRR